jgi:hypothetical protein
LHNRSIQTLPKKDDWRDGDIGNIELRVWQRQMINV